MDRVRVMLIVLLLIVQLDGCSQTPPATPASTAVPVSEKIASSLRDVIQRLHSDGVTASNVTARHAASYSTTVVRVDTAGRLQVMLRVTAVDPAVTAQLTQHHMQIEHVDTARHLMQGWIFFERLTTIAALPFVQHIGPPSYAVRRSSFSH
jgi:hypothetical protein